MRRLMPILVIGALVSACQSGPEPRPKAPAGPVASATVDGGPGLTASSSTVALGATMNVVARIHHPRAKLSRGGLDDLVLETGILVFEARKGRAFQLQGEPQSYTDDGGEDLVGSAAVAPSKALRMQERVEQIAFDDDGTSVTLRGARVDLGEGALDRCELAPSADGHVYATCSGAPLLLRTPDAWVRVERANALALDETRPRIAVARDGAIWAWEREKRLTRILPDGRKEQVSLPLAPEELARPTYEGSYPEMMSATLARGGNGETHFWQSTTVVPPRPPREIAAMENLVPLRDGSVWALGWEAGDSHAMTLLRTGPSTAPPIAIGTPFDQQNELRNAKPPRPWTGHCPQVFVAFDVAAHHDEAKEALRARSARIRVDVVSGRLGEQEEPGVLFLRSEPESSPAALEKAVAKLLMVPRAEAFCTAPVLHRLLEPR